MEKRYRLRRGILLFSLVTTVIIVAVADVFNSTHLFNLSWPAHARFHIGMQFTTLVLVSLASFYGWKRHLNSLAALAPITFWPSLFAAYPIPGTSPYATPALEAAGIPINLIIAGVWFALTLWGWMLTKETKTNF